MPECTLKKRKPGSLLTLLKSGKMERYSIVQFFSPFFFLEKGEVLLWKWNFFISS